MFEIMKKIISTTTKEEPSENFRSHKQSNKIKNVMGLISRKERTEELEARTIEVMNLSNRENIDFNRKK